MVWHGRRPARKSARRCPSSSSSSPSRCWFSARSPAPSSAAPRHGACGSPSSRRLRRDVGARQLDHPAPFRPRCPGGVVAGISTAYGNTVLVGIPAVARRLRRRRRGGDGPHHRLHLPVMMTASAFLIVRAERLDRSACRASAPGRWRWRPRPASPATRSSSRSASARCGRLLGVPLDGLPEHGRPHRRCRRDPCPLCHGHEPPQLRHPRQRRRRAGACGAETRRDAGSGLLTARYPVPMPPVWAKVAVVAAACPTGVNAYVVAARFRTGEALASNAITISTGLAVLASTLWMTIIELV